MSNKIVKNSKLLYENKMYCICCGKLHKVQHRKRTVKTVLNNKYVEFVENFIFCKNKNKIFMTPDIIEINILNMLACFIKK